MAKEANPHEIEKLPIKLVRIGNEIKRVRYDAHNKILYRLNEDDTWDGSFVRHDLGVLSDPCQDNSEDNATKQTECGEPAFKAPPTEDLREMPPLELSSEQAGEPATEEVVPEEIREVRESSVNETAQNSEEEPAEEKNVEEQTKKSRRKVSLFPILCVALAAMIGVSLWGSVQDKLPKDTGPAASTEDTSTGQVETTAPVTEAPTQNDTQPAVSDGVYVQVMAPNITLIPGQELTAEMIDYIDIPEEDYQQLATATGIYTSEEITSLEGMVAQKYIPAGRYLTYDDIGRLYSPSNPWAPDLRNASTIILPINPAAETLYDFIWGNRIDITITVQTKQTNTNDAQSAEETAPNGVQHESSVVESMVVDTYKLQGVKIVDILNADQQSLFVRYSALSAIPNALQVDYLKTSYSDPAVFQLDLPAYISISVTQAQADVIASLEAETMTITVSNAAAENTTDLQYDTFLEIQEVVGSIAAAWPQPPEEGAVE